MTENSEASNMPSALIDKGFILLDRGSFQEAAEVFEAVLREDPHTGFGCLGRAMARNHIHNPQELSLHWESLSQQTGFQELLSPAPEDFLTWLQGEMEKLQISSAEAAPEAPAHPGFLTRLSSASPGRKLLLIFAGVQVLLYLGAALCLWLSDPISESPSVAIPGSLIAAAVFCGGPVILGPVYGNAILRGSRLQTLLKVLNWILCLGGLMITAILAAAFLSSWQEAGPGLRSDGWTCIAYGLCFLTYAAGLIFPMILRRVNKG